MACNKAQTSPSTTRNIACCLCEIPTTKLPVLLQKQAPNDVTLISAKNVASTLHFNYPGLGFSHCNNV
jgi:hypothetical protein